MPTVILKVDLPGANPVAQERPGEVLAGQQVPAAIMPAGGQRQYPDVDSLLLWQGASSGVAFVGVINMRSGKIYLRPLKPRPILDAAAPGGYRFETTPYAGWSISKGGVAVTPPIEHNAGGQTSHSQLRDYAVQKDNIPVPQREDFAGFALTKRGGTIALPHELALRSGTLNKKFRTHGGANALSGYTLPTDWVNLIKSTLERHLPN